MWTSFVRNLLGSGPSWGRRKDMGGLGLGLEVVWLDCWAEVTGLMHRRCFLFCARSMRGDRYKGSSWIWSGRTL